MDKVFKVMVRTEDVTKVFYVNHIYDVQCLIENLRSDEIANVSVLHLTDVSRDNADKLLHD